MVIDFDSAEWTPNYEFKGGKGTFYNKMTTDGSTKIMLGRLEPGASIGYHRHTGEAEMLYVLSGSGIELVDDGEVAVCPGECHYCQDGHSHSLINTSESDDLVFFSVIK
ncbi:Cupin domain-containing protein [Ruminococcaceae bacterium YRB3002]|nr:Cupin domain-containing protein [Ruminococcaceae bacterium YRB3002]